MRRLLRLSLEGFKTFSGRTELTLGPGLTAIVGPNGSGKSNLIDAIAWAVGDRSPKSLRGEGMEDVLFHGDERRAAAPVARVTLGFANEDRLLGLDFSEVTVTRELRRGEGSRATLNGVEAKLKDVQAVLSGTGLVGGFSLLRQGAVDKVILGGPQDVGRWLEESANIAGYRRRKQEASDRLRKVEVHAAEAARKQASLRRDLAQVQERSARVRARRALDAERRRLRTLLSGWERRRIDAALSDLEAREKLLGERMADVERQVETVCRRRTQIQEELVRERRAERDGVPSCGPAGIARLRVGIERAQEQLRSMDERLRRDGEAAWDDCCRSLADLIAHVEQLLAPDLPLAAPGTASIDARLAELRRLDADAGLHDRERRRLSDERSEKQCDHARLEERRRSLGAEDGDASTPDGAGGPEEVDAAGRALEAIDRELVALGPVDETAPGREEEIRKELEALGPVLLDLQSSQTKLTEFMNQLERYTGRIFEETRLRVEQRFRAYCGLLFEGGEARLSRAEPLEESGSSADASTPGLDVRVKLPRKPELPLTLLSGGERSLAGIALVLALAAGDGAPGGASGRLLILDEVDAALDERNASRLGRLLRDLQTEHQILCVTHNRQTMKESAQLVGVTSSGTASSRLLNVRLDVRGPEDWAA